MAHKTLYGLGGIGDIHIYVLDDVQIYGVGDIKIDVYDTTNDVGDIKMGSIQEMNWMI